MKFACLGYMQEETWEAIARSEQDAEIEECFSYDDELVRHGHWVAGGQALQHTRTARTLRWKDGKVVVTDGPFAETKEQLGGIGLLEARDLDHAVELISKHPGLRIGPFEIRPVDEQSLQRQQAADAECGSAGASAGTTTFACLGYIPADRSCAPSESERPAMMEECLAFDKARRRGGHWIGGFALQGAATAKTLRAERNRVLVTDGPFAETKEQLGGLVVNRFRDMRHAIEVLSQHPALRYGVTIEIRPVDEELNARWEARQSRALQPATQR